jgi:hypothetical protein
METRAARAQVNEATEWHNRYYNRHFFSQELSSYIKDDIENPRRLMESWTGSFNRFTVSETGLRMRPGWAGNSVERTTQWLGINPAKYLGRR